MPPIKRTQKQTAASASTRRIAGHSPTTRRETAATTPEESAPKRSRRTAPSEASEDRGRRRGLARPLTYAALVAGVAAGAAGTYLAFLPGISVDNTAFVEQAATDEVIAAASTNVQRLVSIDHENLDAYHDSLGEFLTPNLVEELEKNWPALKESYEQSATTVDAQVLEAGLSYLQGDSAEVLLVQDVSMERDGAAAGSTSGTYLVGLTKVDGTWKLSKIPDLPS